MFIWNLWTVAEHSLPLSVCTILGSGESLQISMYLLAFHEDYHKFATGLDQGWKGCFFLPNVVIKRVASEEREIHLSGHLEFLCVQIQSYKHISGGCWDPPWAGNWRRISALCHLQSWNKPILPELGPKLRAPEKHSSYHYKFHPAFILVCIQLSFPCDPFFIWWFRDLSDIAGIVLC